MCGNKSLMIQNGMVWYDMFCYSFAQFHLRSSIIRCDMMLCLAVYSEIESYHVMVDNIHQIHY